MIKGEIANVPVCATVDFTSQHLLLSTRIFNRRPSRLVLVEETRTGKIRKYSGQEVPVVIVQLSVDFNGNKQLMEVHVIDLTVDAVLNVGTMLKFKLDPVRLFMFPAPSLALQTPVSLKSLAGGRVIEETRNRIVAMTLPQHVQQQWFKLRELLNGPTRVISPKRLSLLAEKTVALTTRMDECK